MDVLIALFGGLAGIVGITRQEKSNVIPGVAIATALMPPVCTAGFGIATGQWQFAGGALYLYAINCVFISLATVVGIRALRLRRHGFANQKTEKRVKATLLALALITSVPSGYLALDLVRQEVFRAKAQEFVDREFIFDKSQLVDTKIDPDKRIIDLSILGEPISPEALHHIEAKLATANLEGTKLVLHQAGENRIDLTALKSSLLSDLLRESQDTVKRRDTQVQNLKAELAARDAILGQANGIFKELRQLYPEVTRVLLADGVSVTSEESKEKVVYITITTRIAMSKEIHQRTEDWLKVRLNLNSIVLNFDTEGQPLKR